MTAKEYLESLTYDEEQNFLAQLETWLGGFTTPTIHHVLTHLDEIVNNPVALNLIEELHYRTLKERKEHADEIRYLIKDFDSFKEYDVHNHCISHAQSYRDVLYDMYVRD